MLFCLYFCWYYWLCILIGLSFNKYKLSSNGLSFLGDMPHLYRQLHKDDHSGHFTFCVGNGLQHSFGGYMIWGNSLDLFPWIDVFCAISSPLIRTLKRLFISHLSEFSPGFEIFVKVVFSESYLWCQECKKRTVLRTLGSACHGLSLHWGCTSQCWPSFLAVDGPPNLVLYGYSCLKWIKHTIQPKSFLTLSYNII